MLLPRTGARRGAPLHPSRLPGLWVGLVLLLLCAGPVQARQDEPPPSTLADALRSGTPTVDLRYRFERVSDDAFGLDAHASTLRTALGYRTGRYHGFELYLEAENVTTVFGAERYNNAGAGALHNGAAGRPVVADPAGTAMNQAYLRFARGATTATLGRQEILLHDQRFVGHVGWRQNHQSFDALRVENTSLPYVTLTYAFVDDVHRIFGDALPMRSHLADLSADLKGRGTGTLYAYLLEYDNEAQAGLSTITLGGELSGRILLNEDARLLYELEVATQGDAGDNPDEIDAAYAHLMAGVSVGKATARGGWERLGGGEEQGRFTTPLATLHAFNGWADRFLNTPADGLDDFYLSLAGPLGPLQAVAVYHAFRAASGAARYGDEVDVQFVYATPWQQILACKAALYRADAFSSSTRKWMLWTAYRF